MRNYKYKKFYLVFLSVISGVLNLFIAGTTIADEDTYSISLVQTAEVAKEIVELEDKKVLTETYVAQKGDHIWKILRSKNALEKNNLGDLLFALKKLNQGLSNIDLIHPGEKIIIPLIITPVSNREKPENMADAETASIEDLENLEYYTVRSGDSLIRVINDKYSVPGDDLYNEYLGQLKKLNPEIKNLNKIYPGQKVRLPIYSPKIARGVIEEKPTESKPNDDSLRIINKEKGEHLKKIFELIGEEWIEQGKHYIPLKTRGQIDLNTETYPIINLRNGYKVIVDLSGTLPDKMVDLLKSNWDSYNIVHITEKDDLMDAVEKVISACRYDRVYTRDESLVLEEGFKLELTADWIIKLLPDPSTIDENIICLFLTGENSMAFPSPLKKFLMGHGIKIVEYPEPFKNKDTILEPDIVTLDDSRNNTIEKILELFDQKYSSSLDIPIYKGEDADFNLVVKADYFFNRNGKDCIIDLKGIGDDISGMLKEHSFSVLSLSGEHDLYVLTEKILGFLGIGFDKKEHTFYALSGSSRGNAKLVIPGILVDDARGRSNLFSSTYLNPDISRFLSTKVDRIFFFSQPSGAEGHGRQDTSN